MQAVSNAGPRTAYNQDDGVDYLVEPNVVFVKSVLGLACSAEKKGGSAGLVGIRATCCPSLGHRACAYTRASAVDCSRDRMDEASSSSAAMLATQRARNAFAIRRPFQGPHVAASSLFQERTGTNGGIRVSSMVRYGHCCEVILENALRTRMDARAEWGWEAPQPCPHHRYAIRHLPRLPSRVRHMPTSRVLLAPDFARSGTSTRRSTRTSATTTRPRCGAILP